MHKKTPHHFVHFLSTAHDAFINWPKNQITSEQGATEFFLAREIAEVIATFLAAPLKFLSLFHRETRRLLKIRKFLKKSLGRKRVFFIGV